MKSLRGKIVVGFVAISILCVVFTSCISYYEIYHISTEYMQKDGIKVAEQIKNDLDLTGIDDLAGVQNYVEGAKEMNNQISFIAFLSNDKVLADSEKNEVNKYYKNQYTEKVFKNKNIIGFIDKNYAGEKVFNVLVPLKEGAKIDNIVSVGMSMSNMNKEINNTIITILLVGLIIIIVSLIISQIIAKNILKPLSKFVKDFDAVSDGDLRVNFTISTNDEISKLGEVMNDTMKNLRNMILELKEDVIGIDKTAEKLSESNNVFSETSKESLDDLNVVSTSVSHQTIDIMEMQEMINEFGINLDVIYEKLDSVGSNSEGIRLSADTGTSKIIELTSSLETVQKSFDNVIIKVEQLSDSVHSIGQITNVINEVANQTNLLALNAAIEAARVGDEGLGFAVVAEEIRKLANQVLQSSKNINKLIHKVKEETKDVSSTSRLVSSDIQKQLKEFEEAISSFKGILSQVSEIVPHIKDVEETLEKSVNEKNDLLIKIKVISEVSKKIALSSEEISSSIDNQAASTNDLKELYEKLNNMSKILKVSIEKFIV